MPTSSVAVRSLTFAVLGFGAAATFGQGSNVTAFSPWQSSGTASRYAADGGSGANDQLDVPVSNS